MVYKEGDAKLLVKRLPKIWQNDKTSDLFFVGASHTVTYFVF